ncbi:glycine--tRNA ligase [Flavobacteriaceae bacterium]|jgi:glycyl-tRNA synthetase|nr:glycine--tRNA ligase [Flavobacteriaceae bacterium]MDC0386003.1 glycine--tRNA ligase [Flavobacteriaceae bacterium]MDC3241208.1 glycine--tRNA ligase [Flavobacteriaceae bacterium]
MAQQADQFKKVISHAKEYGFVFPSSEIYDGLSAVYDYGQNGAALKKNIRDYWWKAMVQLNENIVGIDSAIFMHPTIWKASGHVDAFNDPLIDNKVSKKRYRADVLVEDYVAKIEAKIEKEVAKAAKRFGEAFDEVQFKSTNPRVLEYQKKADTILKRLGQSLEKEDLSDVKALIEELEISCPESGSRDWTEVKQFNLMFGTKLGASAESAMDLYLRPETAQGIFVNFLNVQKTGRMKLPFGIAQTGKAFRNEIVARQFIFRMREFEQMEMQFFIPPGTQKEWYAHWKENRLKWHLALGMGANNYRFHDHEKLAHYADAAADIEFRFPFGFKELEGIHSRTDFDLASHEKYTGKKLQYFDPERNENYVPYVVETSIGLDRMFLAVLSHALTEETLDDGTLRTVLKLPPALAPTKVAVLPLVKKDGLPEYARKIVADLKWNLETAYDEKDAVGRRYRRQDALGTPYCVTVDHQSLEDQTVTLRERDSMQQERVAVDDLKKLIVDKVALISLLKKL